MIDFVIFQMSTSCQSAANACASNAMRPHTGVYLANQLDGKIFDQPGLMPTKQSYSDFVQTKVRNTADGM